MTDIRYHASHDMVGLGEFESVATPAAAVIRPDGSIDVYGNMAVIDQRATVGEGFAVTIALGGGIIGTMRVDIGMDQAESIADAMAGDDDSTLRAGAVAWNTIGREAVFTANGVSHSAAECTEWWA